MNGYLQRLVQTAAQPAQSVHPFVGSIFASSHDDQTRGIESEEFVAATPAIDRHASPTLQPQAVPQHNTQPEAVPLREYRPIAPGSVVTPLQTEGEANALLFQQQQFAQRPRPSVNTQETNVEQLSSPVTSQTEFHPVMSQEPFAAEPDLPHAPFLAKTRASGDKSRSVARERTNDDIQIHIGRIEVTAVHPPAPRTAKTPDRGPSLDAYLNRRAR
jgi:hypothetical protein